MIVGRLSGDDHGVDLALAQAGTPRGISVARRA
jgi:hypothetical protein